MTINWTPRTRDDYESLRGFDVLSADGKRFGEVTDILYPPVPVAAGEGGHLFRVESNLLRGDDDDVYIPESAIRSIDASRSEIVLILPLADARDHDWGRPLQDDDAG